MSSNTIFNKTKFGFKRLAQNFLYNFNVHTNSTVDPSEIKSFISKLKDNQIKTDLVRVGHNFDGGYLVPDDFEGIKYCFSPGVGHSTSFEQELLNKYKIMSFLLDPVINKNKINSFVFDNLYLNNFSDDKNITLSDWISKYLKLSDQKEMILQMDIERSETSVLIETPAEVLKKFRIIIIEFHNFEELTSKYGYLVINSIFNKLLSNFKIVHIHPNNSCGFAKYKGLEIPRVLEISFLRNERLTYNKDYNDRLTIPHKLDIKCDKNKKDIVLPDYWF